MGGKKNPLPSSTTKSILCPEAPRKNNSNREGQQGMERGALQQGDGRDTNDGLGNVYGPKAPEGSKA